ncbi:hydroxymethylpyrimidine/phosphomethylpyrimidine kinase [Meinhardsimonia xiamenensis]|uniref:hydroxymethylpyrimidine kinase n=1 Tax=Meinhardsimonia xiamenensis TaxID=990712 RepID=A0A1G9EEH9_9RHOB|nr:bifunctional hydroxymethylpyrimidine kinase/phosphomethylpyrimidine kinase [Meinhardsimonia xiamenensis]PRX33804.1 hydroxymethylpyrimidine/phosphomethylpyrimidine kinase [Meinhardsimonia xiamenensis]SDK74514.1 hydroxymethylpyrimidine/phosphomethylpyrimidine kinase [Meinhardsimonia xiamenensis]
MSARVLFIGGTDSSGGAGLARDITTAARLGAEPAVAVTSVTAQSDEAVAAAHHLPPAHVAAQISAAGPVAAVKSGMLANAAIVEAVARSLPDAPLVIDPVLAASSGHALIDAEGVEALLALLLPRAALLTPNLPELSRLARHLGLAPDAPVHACTGALLAQGCGAVLVKGGHGAPAAVCTDALYTAPDRPPQLFEGPRLAGSLRGTGCRLASGIAVFLARGLPLEAAIGRSRAELLSEFRRAIPAGAAKR